MPPPTVFSVQPDKTIQTTRVLASTSGVSTNGTQDSTSSQIHRRRQFRPPLSKSKHKIDTYLLLTLYMRCRIIAWKYGNSSRQTRGNKNHRADTKKYSLSRFIYGMNQCIEIPWRLKTNPLGNHQQRHIRIGVSVNRGQSSRLQQTHSRSRIQSYKVRPPVSNIMIRLQAVVLWKDTLLGPTCSRQV